MEDQSNMMQSIEEEDPSHSSGTAESDAVETHMDGPVEVGHVIALNLSASLSALRDSRRDRQVASSRHVHISCGKGTRLRDS
jgi:hypothetical protein